MKNIYVAVLGLSLISGGAYASVNTDIAPDDDASIANIGQTYVLHQGQMNEVVVMAIDDDESIANIGDEGQHVSHSAEVEAGLFLENDLSL